MAEIYKSNFSGQEIDERLELIPEIQEGVEAAQQAADGKYTKPASGIPLTDLSDEVQEAIEEGGVQADWEQEDTTAPDYIKNKPSIPTHVVRFVQQFLSDSERIQARANIGAGTYSKPATGIPAEDLADDVIPDVSGFITNTVNNLVNYYLKSETYSRSEVQQLISAIQGVSFVSVQTLPTASADTMGGKIYLVPSTNPDTQNVKDEFITIQDGSTYAWEQIGSTTIDLSGYVTTQQLNTALAAYTTTEALTALLAAKQDTISDLSTIRSGAAAGATAYQKPQTGIPASDLASGVIPTVPTDIVKYSSQSLTDAQQTQARTNIGAAAAAALTTLETAIAAKYTKPSSGIPETDLAANVQSALALARTSIQSLADYYDKTQIDSLLAAVSSEQYVDVTTLPTASASTLGKIYLVGPTNGVYDRYYTSYDGTTYSWVGVGTTEINLANYATKDELSQLSQEIGETELKVDEVVQENNNVFNLSSATARDNSSANITWSVSDGTMTASTSVNTNQHLYLNINGTTAGKRYMFSATVTNLAQPLLVKHIGSSNYEEATIDGTTYTAEFVSTGEDFLDFLFRNRTITMSDVSVRELPIVSVKPSAIGNLTFANMNAGAVALIPQMASHLSFVPANANMPNAALNYDSTNDVIQIKNQTVICGITIGYKSASATNLTPLDTTTAQLVVYDVSNDLFKMARYNAVLTDSEIIIASFRKTTSSPDKSSFATVLPWSVDGFLYNIRTIADVPKSRGFTKGINHRGYNGVAPENTIPAFKLSAKMGFVYVETDVRYTSDGVAVLLHDASINRTARNEDGTEISGVVNIADITYEDALDYDFGIWEGAAYAGTKIPTFEAFIILCRNLGLHPYIELKAGTQAQIEELVYVVGMYGMRGKVSWISGNSQYLGYVKDCDEQARLGYIEVPSSVTIQTAVSLRNGKNDVFMTSNSYTDAIVELCKAASMPLEVWTINTTEALALVPAYVSGVTSNSLDASVELYETD